jgi:ABC-type Fe3+ transport system permease subunit
MMTRSARLLLVLVLAAVLLPSLVSACPLCKDAKSDTDYPGGTASLPKGFFYSILLMVSAPFVVVGTLILRIYLARRRRQELPAVATVERGASSFVSASPEART